MVDVSSPACAWLIERLHALVEDHEFANLPSQSAMLGYALRKIPELEVLGEATLNFEIQELRAAKDVGFD